MNEHCPGCGTLFPGDIANERLGHAEHCPVWEGAEAITQLRQLTQKETTMADDQHQRDQMASAQADHEEPGREPEEIDLMKALVDSLPDRTDPALVPPDVKRAIDNYANLRRRPGDFVLSVLKNNLTEAVGRADFTSLRVIAAIVSYCYNDIPAPCWGSPDIVEAWLTPATAGETSRTTTRRACVQGLKRVINEHSDLLRIELGKRRFTVAGATEDSEVVWINTQEMEVMD